MQATRHSEVTVLLPSGGVRLQGCLTTPRGMMGLVVFGHRGRGSNWQSGLEGTVGRALNERGLATLDFDLLTPAEEAIEPRTRMLRFGTALLAKRLTGAIDWAEGNDATLRMPIGLFGSSTAVAAALMAAASRRAAVRALVTSGGRPDLADRAPWLVEAPTLMIVGGRDLGGIVRSEEARRRMRGEPRLEIVPGAGHLLDEPETLEVVAGLACRWFREYLGRGPDAPQDGGNDEPGTHLEENPHRR